MKKNKLTRSLLCCSLAILLLFSAVSCNTTPPKPSETTEAIITDAGISGETTEEITSDAGISGETTTAGETSAEETTALSPEELVTKITRGISIDQVISILGEEGEELDFGTISDWYKWDFTNGDLVVISFLTQQVPEQNTETKTVDQIFFSPHGESDPEGFPTIRNVLKISLAMTYSEIVSILGYEGSFIHHNFYNNLFVWKIRNARVVIRAFCHQYPTESLFSFPNEAMAKEIYIIPTPDDPPTTKETFAVQIKEGMNFETAISILGSEGLRLDSTMILHREWELENGKRLILIGNPSSGNDYSDCTIYHARIFSPWKEEPRWTPTSIPIDRIFDVEKGMSFSEVESLLGTKGVALYAGDYSRFIWWSDSGQLIHANFASSKCLNLYLSTVSSTSTECSTTTSCAQKIQTGMTYHQVLSVLGSNGHLQYNLTSSPQPLYYQWTLEDGSTLNIFFKWVDRDSPQYPTDLIVASVEIIPPKTA